jgi:hypothetical protein
MLVFGHLNLEVHHSLIAEGAFRRRQIELPHPAETLVIDRLDLVAVGVEAIAPAAECFRVVKT